jgi:hypothetical protein
MPLIKYIIKPTHKRVKPYLCIVFLKQSNIPEYVRISGVCFCNFTFILSAGNEMKAVVIEAKIAEQFSKICEF